MGDYKFDTFYYSKDKSSDHFLSEIENLSDEDFQILYKGQIHCPYCHGPLLSLVKKEGVTFLRAYPKQPHILVEGEECLYANKTASKTVMEKYIQELREEKKIKSLLEATMRRLLKRDYITDITSSESENETKDPLLIERVQSDKTIERNIIPHYSFKTWGKNIPQNQLLIVYGKVYIDLKQAHTIDQEGNKITKTYMHFKDADSKKLITSCLKPQTLEVSAGNYYAVVLGKCIKNESSEYTYYNLWINSPLEESVLLKKAPL